MFESPKNKKKTTEKKLRSNFFYYKCSSTAARYLWMMTTFLLVLLILVRIGNNHGDDDALREWNLNHPRLLDFADKAISQHNGRSKTNLRLDHLLHAELINRGKEYRGGDAEYKLVLVAISEEETMTNAAPRRRKYEVHIEVNWMGPREGPFVYLVSFKQICFLRFFC